MKGAVDMNNIDLHMHSHYSDDGEFTPAELMRLCKDAGLQIVAIADHNTIEAIPEAKKEAEKLGLTYLPAVELDCQIQDVNLHVLGYGIDDQDNNLIKNAERMSKLSVEASSIQIELCEKLGLTIDHDACYALAKNGAVTGEIIAEVALSDSRNHEILKEYLPQGSRSDNPYVNFYWDFCSQGKPAYVPMDFISLKEAVDMIHHANGIAVLAHPGNNTKENIPLLDAIFAQGVQGMEVYSSYHTPQQIQFYETYAKQHRLLVTMGSDFHGKTKPSISLGGSGCPDTSLFQDEILNIKNDHKG